jgi:hypothetical protein
VPLTPVALDAKPDSVGRKDFFPHPQEHHANDAARVKLFVDISDRASGCTKATSETKLDISSAWLTGDIVLELHI